MEYMIVIVPGKEDQDIEVLIDGEKNGKVGQILTLGSGWVEVSVDLPGAEAQDVNLENTTPTHPKTVEIKA